MKSKKAVAALMSLAQETRLAIFMLLLENGDEGLPATVIAEQLDIPPTTMSFHLTQLKNSGMLEVTRKGRYLIYSANRKRAKKLANYITGKEKSTDLKYQL